MALKEVKMPNFTTYNIKMVKGDTESFGFELEGVENLDAAYFSCKRNSQDENYLFQRSLNSGITKESGNYRTEYRLPAEPSRIGYTFLGFYTDEACRKKATDLKVGTTGDITFYAKWQANK